MATPTLDARTPATAHGIQRTGLCKVSGRHLSQAANEPESATEYAQRRAEQNDREALLLQVHAMRCAGVL